MINYAFEQYRTISGYSKANLSEIVVSHIKNKILSGDIKNGDRLIETDLSEELQISRAPVREALRELNVQGIVSFSPRKGSQILEVSYADVAELFSIRAPLEMQVLTILFEQSLLKEEDIDHLEMLNQEMLKADSKKMNLKERIYVLNINDLAFHRYFWTKSRSMRRAHILEGQYFQLLLAMNQDLTTLGSTREKFEEHRRIIEACRSGSLEKTLSAFKRHMNSYLDAVTGL